MDLENTFIDIITVFSNYSFQPDVSKYCADLMPLLLDYLSSLSQAKVGHVTKAFYALENFMENLGMLKRRFRRQQSQLQAHPLQEETEKLQI